MDSQASASYAEREKRFADIVALRKPDRIPLIPMVVQYFPTTIKGVSKRAAGFDNALRYRCTREATLEFGWDLLPNVGVLPSAALDALGIKQIRWPGGDLPDDADFQFVENEWVRDDEYDAFLQDPNGFTLSRIFPRIAAGLSGLGEIPLPPIHWLSNAYTMLSVGSSVVAAPQIRKVLECLLEFSDAAEANLAAYRAHVADMATMGYPVVSGGTTYTAFDWVSDFFRGLRGGSLDIYRHPDKLLAAVELMHPMSVGIALRGVRASGIPRVMIPLHRGADNFMNEEAFEKFYWPTFRSLIETLVAEGITPMPVFEGNYTSRLKYLAQLPAGKVAGHFDRIDRKKFKEMCGDVMCFWGNVPASLLCAGTPQQVKDDVKELIDLFGDTGLIIDTNQGMPNEAKPENAMALREAADEYGSF